MFKKAIVYLSIAALAAPVLASGTVGVASAATNNVRSEKMATPNSNYKVPFRDANSIFNLKLDKQPDGYVLFANIVASGDNVIQKGEKLVVSFDDSNVDLNDSSIANQTGNLPYSVEKNLTNNTVTFTFNQNVDQGSFQSAIGIATKNVYTTTKLKANFQGAKINIANNSLTSKWQQPQEDTVTNNNYQTTSNSTSYQSTQSTQGISSVQSSAQPVSTTSQTQAESTTQSYTVTKYVNGSQTQASAANSSNTSNQYTPTYDEAEQAIMNRTTISITGTANNVATQQASNQTDDSTAKVATTTQSGQTGNVNKANNIEVVGANNTNGPNGSNGATPVANSSDTNNAQQSDPVTANQNQTSATDQTQASTQSPTTTPTTTPTTAVQATTSNTQVIQTPDGQATDPKQTLQQALQTQGSAGQSDQTAYQSNPTFEKTKSDITNKIPDATHEEQSEVVKTIPWIWKYIANSNDQSRDFNFATKLTTGRIAHTEINGVADLSSNNILQQNMPKLLKTFGENIQKDSFDKPVDIDDLLASQVYQDYLAGKYTPTSDKLDSKDAWNAIDNHMTISKVSSDSVAGATKLPLTYYSAKKTLDDEVASAKAKKAAEDSANLVINSNVAANQNDSSNGSGTSQNNSALYALIKNDVFGKMGNGSQQDKYEVLGAIPDALNQISNNTSSQEKLGKKFSFVKPTSDGNYYLINFDTRALTGSSDKYLAVLPQVFKAFGDSLRKGDFDKAISIQLMYASHWYQDYQDGKYIPDFLKVQTVQKNDRSDLLAAIIAAIILIPVLAVLMPVVALVTAPLWLPIALAVFTVGFIVTALPILLLTLGILISPFVLPIAAIFTIVVALAGLVLNLIPILKLITIPITLIAVIGGAIVTVLSVIGILLWLPVIIITGIVVLAGLIIPVIMCLAIVALAVIAGLIALPFVLLPILVPILALIGLIVAGIFSLLGLILFPVILPLLLIALPVGIWIAIAAVLTVVAAALPWIIGGFLGTLVGILLIVLAWYPIFNIIALIGGVLLFLTLIVLLPMFLVLGFLFWFIGFGFMALIFPGLASIGLILAMLVGAAMMTLFIPGVLIALSWPFWMSLVLLVSVPIVAVLVILGLIPVVGWVMGPVAGIAILIQAIALLASVVIPIMIGVSLVTKAIVGFDIFMAAAAVLELLKDKVITKYLHFEIDPKFRLRIHPVGFWTKSDPLGLALN